VRYDRSIIVIVAALWARIGISAAAIPAILVLSSGLILRG